jgi:hypothetical protein
LGTPQQNYEHTRPGDDDRTGNPYTGDGNERREKSVQFDPKKPKRKFGNRTKTGYWVYDLQETQEEM